MPCSCRSCSHDLFFATMLFGVSICCWFFSSFPFGNRPETRSLTVRYESSCCIPIIIVVKKIQNMYNPFRMLVSFFRRVPKQSMFETAIESSGAAGTRAARSPDKIARTQCRTWLFLLSYLHDVRRRFRTSNRAQEA